MLNIAIAGSSGRMGRMLLEAVLTDPQARLSGALSTRPKVPAAPVSSSLEYGRGEEVIGMIGSRVVTESQTRRHS